MKKKRIKSAIPIYAAAAMWLLMGLICPRMLLKIWFIALTALLSAGAYFVASRFFPGREIEVREAVRSGDKAIDAMIVEGQARLDNLKALNASIPDPEITSKLNRMVKSGEEIFGILEKDTSKANAVRRFMNYYLPTAEKLIRSYEMMQKTGGGENIAHAMRSVENSLGMIADAFEKQLDNLYQDRALDIETDIEVLETMMAGDGLTDPQNLRQAQRSE